MTQSRRLRVALLLAGLGAALVPAAVVSFAPAAFAADKPDKAHDIRDALKKPLSVAQAAMKEQKYADAIAALVDTDAVTDKTPYETYVIAQFRAISYSNLKDTPNSIKNMEIMVDSGQEESEAHLKTVRILASQYWNAKDYAKVVIWTERFQKDGGADQQMSEMQANAYYLTGDYAKAATELSKQIAAVEATGQKPDDEKLHLLISCYIKQKDDAGYVRILEKMAVYYPSKDRWRDLTGRIQTRPGFADRLVLDVDRLERKADALENSDYLEWAQFAMQAGLPSEAKSAFDAGVAIGAIDPAAQKVLADRIKKAAADDQKALAQGDAELAKAKDGNPFVNNGVNYLNYGQYDKGVSLIEQGIAKGGLKHPEEAKLHLGYAYYLTGQNEKAVETLKTVGGDDGAAGIAHLWVLLITGKPDA